MLSDGAPATRALVADRHSLRVPGEGIDTQLIGDPACDLAMRSLGCAPLIEDVESLLRAAPCSFPDPLV